MTKIRTSVVLLVLGHAFACSSADAPSGEPGGNPPAGNGGNTGTPGSGTPGNGETPGTGGTPGNGGTPGTGGAPDDAIVPTDSVWRSTSEWYRAIDSAPVAEASPEMIGALAKWGQTGVFQIDFSFNILSG